MRFSIDHIAIEIRNMSADMTLQTARGSKQKCAGRGGFFKERRSI
jgi:hypothetical protein